MPMKDGSMAISMTNETTTTQIPDGIDRWARLVFSVFKRVKHGKLTVVLPDGRPAIFVGTEPGPDAIVQVLDMAAFKQFVMGGDTGFAEAYMDGITDSPDMSKLVELFVLNKHAFEHHKMAEPFTKIARRILHWLNANTKSGSRRNIAAHYDLGNAFYERWLDPSMTYSSAVFSGTQQDLEAAQIEKYRRIADGLDLKPGQKVLEIGCGWGGFAAYAAKIHDVEVLGVTLSAEQHAYATDRMRREGVSDKVEIRLQDYRDVRGTFDAIASIEMLEAVGQRYWTTFFNTVRDRLRAGGKAGLQIITIMEDSFEDYRDHPDFIQKYIFPGGMLPTRTHLRDLSTQAGIELAADEGYGQDYARTLAEWRERFAEAWPEIATLGFDDRFKRMWSYYLAYCEGGFRIGNIDVRQVVLQRP